MTDITSAFQALSGVEQAFAGVPRPDHFTDFEHCEECAEHDQTLITCTPDTIGMDELGNPGWDPICFITRQGFQYYMPGLARIALARENFYLGQFLFHLNHERLSSLNAAQRHAVRNLLEYIRDRAMAEMERDIKSNELQNEMMEMGELEQRIRSLQT
jgi:hypothetical protein